MRDARLILNAATARKFPTWRRRSWISLVCWRQRRCTMTRCGSTRWWSAR